MNKEAVIRFPVVCPKCRQEILTTLPLGNIAAALISGNTMRLYASCHDVYWDAHHSEREQVREYMAAPSLQAAHARPGCDQPAVPTGAAEKLEQTKALHLSNFFKPR